MAVNNDLHIADVGSAIEVCVVEADANGVNQVVDISAATGMQIKLLDPAAGEYTKTAVHTTDGKDGKMHYVVESGLLASGLNGTWRGQGVLTLGAWTGHTAEFQFKVAANVF